ANPAACNIIYGCTVSDDQFAPGICEQWVMCDHSEVLPLMSQCPSGQFMVGTSDGGSNCATPYAAIPGACSAGQYVSATTDAGVVCTSLPSIAAPGTCSAGQYETADTTSGPTCAALPMGPRGTCSANQYVTSVTDAGV